jgi:hypothetical protein
MPKNSAQGGYSPILLLIVMVIVAVGAIFYISSDIKSRNPDNDHGSVNLNLTPTHQNPPGTYPASKSASITPILPTDYPDPATPTPLPVKPKVVMYSPKGGEVMKEGGTFNLFWTINNPPTDKKNWELLASLTSSEGMAAEGKTGSQVFSIPLNMNVGYFTWKVQRSFSDDWAKSVSDLDNVTYQIHLCLVNVNYEQNYALGYWTDAPDDEGVWCNDNPAEFKIHSDSN